MPASDRQSSNVSSGTGTNRIDLLSTVYPEVRLNSPTFGPAEPNCSYEGDGRLMIGGLLPVSGKLSYLHPGQAAAIDRAQTDIEDAGGLTDVDIRYVEGDSGASGKASETVREHLDAGADVILGAPSSAITRSVVRSITGACRLQMSAASTAADIEEFEQNQLFFRTAPSDRLQGQALADLVDDDQTVGILFENESYGLELAQFTTEALRRRQINVMLAEYDIEEIDDTFIAVTDAATSDQPDTVIVIGFEESSVIISELLRRGFDQSQILLSDGNANNAISERSDDLTGIRGIQPGAEVIPSFEGKLRGDNLDLQFAPETYDAMIILALAAEQAGSDAAPLLAAELNGITRDGERCISFRSCKNLIAQGIDIDYDGESGLLEFDSNGEPTVANFGVVQFG